MNRLRVHGAQLVLGLLLALTLWTYVSFATNPNATDEITVPVEPTGLPNGMLIVNTSSGLPQEFAATTRVTVTGPQEDVDDLTPDRFRATANLEGLNPGVQRVEINVEGPPDVRIRSIAPPELTVRVARELVVTVPITVDTTGQPPFSYKPGTITQGANEAVIRGPEESVRRVVGAVAELSLENQTVDLSVTLPLTPVDATESPVEGVTVNPQGVTVQVPIATQLDEKQISVVPRVEGQPAPGYVVGRIDWTPKIVEVVASDVVSGTVQTEVVDVTDLREPIEKVVSLEQIPNVITRPPNVPITVRVSIIPIGVPAQLPLLVSVSPINIDGALTASAVPLAFQVTLGGPIESLSRLASGEAAVTATVDLAGRGPGTHPLPVVITAPEDLTIVEPLNPMVTVTLSPIPTPTPAVTAEPPLAPEASPTP